MVFGAYPQKGDRMSFSIERPLLEENGSSSETSEDLEYDLKSSFLSQYRPKRSPSRYISLPIALAIGIGILILAIQSVLLWRLWPKVDHTEALGEINGLVPRGKP